MKLSSFKGHSKLQWLILSFTEIVTSLCVESLLHVTRLLFKTRNSEYKDTEEIVNKNTTVC